MVENLKEYGLYRYDCKVEMEKVEKFKYDQEDYLVWLRGVGYAIVYSTRDNTVVVETDHIDTELTELNESNYHHEEVYKILSGLRNQLNKEL
jgi:hypothetical protein